MLREISLTTLLVLVFSSIASAELFIENIDPPVLVRGKVNRVSVVGSDFRKIQGLWNSVPDSAVKARFVRLADSHTAIFDIEVDSQAPIGLFGCRIATAAALSNAHIFAIGDVEPIPENELPTVSNQPSMQNAQRVEIPAVVSAVCGRADVDPFVINVKAGQEVTFEVVGSRFGKAFDPLLTIRDSQQQVVLEHDNDVGMFFDFRKTHKFEQAGEYVVEIRDSRFQGSQHWGYLLRMGKFPEARVVIPSSMRPGTTEKLRFPQLSISPLTATAPAMARADYFNFELRRPGDDMAAWIPLTLNSLPTNIEVEPKDDSKHVNKAVVPGSLHGVLSREGDVDVFEFALKKGQNLKFAAESRSIGSPADLEIQLFDPKRKRVSSGDDSGFEESRFNYRVSVDGNYRLAVREFVKWGGPAFAYRIDIDELKPKFTVDSGVTRMAIPLGSHQPLPLSFTRYLVAGNVKLTLLNAPKGMTLLTNTVAQSVREQDNAILVNEDVSPGIYTVQIQANANEAVGKPEALASTHPLIDRMPTGRGTYHAG